MNYLYDLFTRLSLGLAIWAIMSILTMPIAHAQPESSEVVYGIVQITETPDELDVEQTSTKAIVEWKNFDVKENEKVHITQPKDGIMLIRVKSGEQSKIAGKITATGKIILVNEAGVHFTATSEVVSQGI